MALRDDIQLLSSVPLFEGMNEEQLRLLAFGADTRRVGKGQTIFTAGARAEGAYIVRSGLVALGMPSKDGHRRLDDAGPSSLLCELALISDIACPASAVALEDGEITLISRVLFKRLLEEFPEIAAMLDAKIRANIKALVSEIARLKPRFS
jgi:CRP-like cAMP-binding protein